MTAFWKTEHEAGYVRPGGLWDYIKQIRRIPSGPEGDKGDGLTLHKKTGPLPGLKPGNGPAHEPGEKL